MITSFIPKQIKYDGRQIQSLWAYKTFGIQGDSIVSFIGPCNIPFANMVDQEDRLARSKIYSRLMLHFIVEHFDTDLDKAILRQRLLSVIVKDVLGSAYKIRGIRRDGDDLYDPDSHHRGKLAKLSISIATASPVSTKIHFGINIKSKGAPVLAKGLDDYGIKSVKSFALSVMEQYCAEMASVNKARTKVSWIK
ncbi:MAG: DUF366 family protein [Planctomycetota bacterium]